MVLGCFFMGIHSESCVFRYICATFMSEQDNVIASMNVGTNKIPCEGLENVPQTAEVGQDKKTGQNTHGRLLLSCQNVCRNLG